MTHDVLLADIDYAKRQLRQNLPDATIVSGLVTRGIESAKAAQLVDDLRNGRTVTPDLQAAFKTRRRRSEPASDPSGKPISPDAVRQERPHHRSREAGGPLKTRMVIAGVLVAAIGLGGLALYHYRFSPEARQEREERAAAATNTPPPASTPAAPHK